MNIILETPRLLLRKLTPADADYIFELDSNPEVMRYLPPQLPIDKEKAADVIRYIQSQYERNNTGRLAVIVKETGAFTGWCGIKYVDDDTNNGKTRYYDIGYRLLPQFWNRGYATEASLVCIEHGFQTLHLPDIHATVMHGNIASARTAQKIGMTLVEDFTDEDQYLWHWYTIVHPNKRDVPHPAK